MKLGILIDTGGGMFGDDSLKSTNIEIIPLHVILEDKTEFLDTPENIKKHEIFKRVSNKENITTSMASPGELEEKYDEMLKKYDHIIHLTITPNLSGMKDVALMVGRDEKYEGKITVIDHFTAANGIRYTALKMNEAINDGIDSIEEMQKIANIATKEIFLGLIPGDIAKLNRGGRARGMVVGFLKLIKTQFLIRWGEKPKNIALARSIKGIVEKAIEAGIKMSGKDAKVILVKTTNTDEHKILDPARNALKSHDIEYVEELIPSIYGCHAGTETTGIVMIPKKLLQN
jgi:DegV family protein with EDD domain